MAKPLLSFSVFKKKKEKNATLDLFPNSPALNAVNVITSKLLQIESNGDQWLKEQVLFYKKKMVVEYVAFIQLGKCDWDGQVINHWFLLTVPVAYQSNQCWKLRQSPTAREILSWCTKKFSELWCQEKWRSLNMVLKMAKDRILLKHIYLEFWKAGFLKS